MTPLRIVDAHLDLAYNAGRGRDPRQPAADQPIADNEIATVGLPDLRAGSVALIVATIFCIPKSSSARGYTTADEAHAQAMTQWDWYQRQFDDDELRLVTRVAELPKGLNMLLLLEGADAFRSTNDVQEWYNRGLRIVGLAWRGTRMAGGTGEPGPLTEEGRKIVRAMDALGMIHDVSHLAEEAFWQLLEVSGGPVIASHSNCRSIVPTDRQISDEMIRAIVKREGVIGMNFYDKFLMPPSEYKKRRCKLSDMLAHIQHICDLAGNAGHVGLGSDMDGGLGREQIPEEIRTSADLPRIADALSDAGFGDVDVRGIMGENWLRYFQRKLPGN